MNAPQNPPQDSELFFTTTQEDHGQRLDKVLAAHAARLAPELSRTRLQALIRDGQVTLDGAIATDPKLKMRAELAVRILRPEAVDPVPQGEVMALDVVYEDEDLIVIDKPAGLVVHPSAGHDTGTLVNALIAHCGATLSGIGGVKRPGIVHRLDKDTTGLMVVAKNDRAHKALAAQFADHGREGALERAYLAVVWGAIPHPHLTIDAPLDRDPRNRERMAVVPMKRHEEHGFGRFAITHVETLERYPPGTPAPVASLVRCVLETGRTHQIRVHMAHVGHPLLGDPLYGSGFKTKASLLPEAAKTALEKLGRQALHAAMLGFEHPTTGEPMSFESELPADITELLEALARL